MDPHVSTLQKFHINETKNNNELNDKHAVGLSETPTLHHIIHTHTEE